VNRDAFACDQAGKTYCCSNLKKTKLPVCLKMLSSLKLKKKIVNAMKEIGLINRNSKYVI